MPQKDYKIIFNGSIKNAEDISIVKTRLMALLNADKELVDFMFRHGSVTIKTCYSMKEAINYKVKFEQTGAICSILEEIILVENTPLNFSNKHKVYALILCGVVINTGIAINIINTKEQWLIILLVGCLAYLLLSKIFRRMGDSYP